MLAQAGPAAAGASHGHQVLFVSKNASSTGSGRSCDTARYKTIRSALRAAPPWSAVVVCAGSYHEQVVVKKPVSLIGLRATINEKGVKPAFVVNPPGVGKLTIFAGVVIVSSHVRVQGFTITNALGEGVLAAGVQGTISGITIKHNAVVHNDLGGGVPPASAYFECQAQGRAPPGRSVPHSPDCPIKTRQVVTNKVRELPGCPCCHVGSHRRMLLFAQVIVLPSPATPVMPASGCGQRALCFLRAVLGPVLRDGSEMLLPGLRVLAGDLVVKPRARDGETLIALSGVFPRRCTAEPRLRPGQRCGRRASAAAGSRLDR
jgi:hypothetical protein